MGTEHLSSVQQAILLTQKIYSASSLFNVGGYAIIEGTLNSELLEQAINHVLGNADVIEIGNSALNQSVNDIGFQFNSSAFDIIDFSENDHPDQSCLDWILSDSNKRHLYNIKLLKASRHKYYWYVKFHHLIFDGYSMSLFFNNVAKYYSHCIDSKKESKSLEDIYKYSSFINEEIEYKSSNVYKIDSEFWFSRLENLIGKRALQLKEKSWHLKTSLLSKRKNTKIPRILYNQIESFCNANNSNVFHYFIASLLILNRKFNSDSVVLGIPVFNRQNKRYKKTLGTFVNTIPFSIAFNEKIIVADLLQQVSRELKSCYRHLRFPLLDILKEIDQPGNIYNITFSYQKNVYIDKLGDSCTSINYIHSGEQEEDIIFHLLDYSNKEDLVLSVDYSIALFSALEANRMISDYLNILSILLNNAETPVNELDYLSEEGKYLLLEEFNNTAPMYSKDKTITTLFEEQVAYMPDEIALTFEGKSLSYRELNEKSNQLANYLRSVHAINTGELVAIKQNRTENNIVSILGVLKSGGACVPVDPDYPPERIAYMISDSKCKIVLDDQEFENFEAVAHKYNSDKSEIINLPGDLAFVIYTSGKEEIQRALRVLHNTLINNIIWEVSNEKPGDFLRLNISINLIYRKMSSYILNPGIQNAPIEYLFNSELSDDF